MNSLLVLATIFLGSQNSHACATDLKHAPPPSGPWVKYQAQRTKLAAKAKTHSAARRHLSSDSDPLPTARSPESAGGPWGGADATKWQPEAILANAASGALNAAWAQPGVDDALVAVPLKMLYSATRPYGDGQSNSSPRFSDDAQSPWTGTEPPLVATWTTFNSGTPPTLTLHFSKDLPGLNAKGSATLIYYLGGAKQTQVLSALKPSPTGAIDVSWTPSNDHVTLSWGGMFTNNVAYVQAPGRADWLPLDFRDTAIKSSDLLGELPQSMRTYKPTGNPLTDPAKLAATAGDPATPYQKLLAFNPEAFGNHSNFYPLIQGIHNLFGADVTAVGDGTTWVLWQNPAPFKMAVICFDPRDVEAENQFHVPSGGGWHEIGDPAETVLNTLETSDIVFGYANGHPGLGEGPTGGYFRGLTDVAVIRKLKKGSALVTGAGPTTTSERDGKWTDENWPRRAQGGPEGRNYHWFIFNQERPDLANGGGPNRICGTEWVHNCTPSAQDPAGVSCPQ